VKQCLGIAPRSSLRLTVLFTIWFLLSTLSIWSTAQKLTPASPSISILPSVFPIDIMGLSKDGWRLGFDVRVTVGWVWTWGCIISKWPVVGILRLQSNSREARLSYAALRLNFLDLKSSLISLPRYLNSLPHRHNQHLLGNCVNWVAYPMHLCLRTWFHCSPLIGYLFVYKEFHSRLQ